MESTVKPALALMRGRAVAFVATFLLPLALVRVFDQADFGTYKQLFLIYVALYGVAGVLTESLFYFLPRSPGDGSRYVTNAVIALGILGLAALALLWAAAPFLSRALGNPALEHYLPLLGVFLLLMLPASSLEIVLVSRNRYGWAARSYAASDLVRALALVVPALIWRRLDWLLLGAAAFAAARLAATLLYFHREFRGELRPQRTLWREQLGYTVPFAAWALVENLQANYHHYAVSHHFDPATFAIYSVGCFQIPLLELVASPMGNVMMVRMMEMIRDGHPDQALEIWSSTVRALALMFIPLVALLLVTASDLIVLLFTAAYRASVPVFMIWSLSFALSVLPVDSALRVYAATGFLLRLSAIRLVLVVVLVGGAISMFGLPGAVLVTISAAAATKGVALGRLARFSRVPLSGLLPWRKLAGVPVLSACAAVPALVVKSVLTLPPFGRLAVVSAVFTAVYLTLLFHSGLLAEREKQALRRPLQRRPVTALASQTRSS